MLDEKTADEPRAPTPPARPSADRSLDPPYFAAGNEHPVLAIPFTAIIDGRSYEGEGLSLVSASAAGLMPSHMLGDTRLVTLQFGFEGFAVTLPVEAQIVAITRNTGRIELRFMNPSGPHLPQLRHLLNAFVAGDLLRVADVIKVSEGSHGSAASRLPPPRFGRDRVFRKLSGFLVTMALTLALAYVAASAIFQRLFEIELPGLAVIAPEGSTLRATAPGQLDYINPAAGEGEVAYSIRATSGNVISIAMPCTCEAVAFAARGATLLAGEPVMRVEEGSRHVVETFATADAVRALADGATARVGLPGDRAALARLDPATPVMPTATPEQAGLVRVSLVMDGQVRPEDVGKPVTVTVQRKSGTTLIAAIAGNALSYFGEVKGRIERHMQ